MNIKWTKTTEELPEPIIIKHIGNPNMLFLVKDIEWGLIPCLGQYYKIYNSDLPARFLCEGYGGTVRTIPEYWAYINIPK